MGFRFYKKIKIADGLSLNLSKGGMSVSGGVKGARVTAGTSGVTTSAGIPGTGLSVRNRAGLVGTRETANIIDDDTVGVTPEDIRDYKELSVFGKTFIVIVGMSFAVLAIMCLIKLTFGMLILGAILSLIAVVCFWLLALDANNQTRARCYDCCWGRKP